MAERQRLAARFASIIAELDREGSVLDRYCEAGQLLLDADGAAITIDYESPDRHTVTSTSTLALLLETAQDLVCEGPGFDASRSGTVVVGSFGATTRTPWPMLERSVKDLGFVGSVLALPITVANRTMGVLVAHRLLTSLSFDAEAARFLAASLGVVLMETLTPEALEQELTEDWSARAVVHQATGMVVAQLGIELTDALVLLRAHAFAAGVSLVDVAVEVVDRELSFGVGGEVDE